MGLSRLVGSVCERWNGFQVAFGATGIEWFVNMVGLQKDKIFLLELWAKAVQ